MNNSDLSSIREQLLAFQNESEPDAEGSSSHWEPRRSPSLPFPTGRPTTAKQPDQTELVQALRQRSPQPPRQPTPEEIAAAAHPMPPQVNSYLRRLEDEAEKIRELYHQQEMAIQKFQRTAKGLDLILRRRGDGRNLYGEQFCELRDAALTTVLRDETGRLILTAVEIDLNRDEHQAYQDAADIRAMGQSHSAQPSTSLSQALWEQPFTALKGVWESFTGPLEGRTQITPLGILVWCGGGVIGRKALNLLLAAAPGLGPWVIAIMIGAVIFGLYRLLFSRSPDLAFIIRLFLALVGLGIGGQL